METKQNMQHVNNVAFIVHQRLYHIMMFNKGYVALQRSSIVMSHWDISEVFCHIATMAKMWHINNGALDVQKIEKMNFRLWHKHWGMSQSNIKNDECQNVQKHHNVT